MHVFSKNEYMLLMELVLPLLNHKLATIRLSATNAIKGYGVLHHHAALLQYAKTDLLHTTRLPKNS